jgi:hypothetical protein
MPDAKLQFNNNMTMQISRHMKQKEIVAWRKLRNLISIKLHCMHD